MGAMLAARPHQLGLGFNVNHLQPNYAVPRDRVFRNLPEASNQDSLAQHCFNVGVDVLAADHLKPIIPFRNRLFGKHMKLPKVVELVEVEYLAPDLVGLILYPTWELE